MFFNLLFKKAGDVDLNRVLSQNMPGIHQMDVRLFTCSDCGHEMFLWYLPRGFGGVGGDLKRCMRCSVLFVECAEIPHPSRVNVFFRDKDSGDEYSATLLYDRVRSRGIFNNTNMPVSGFFLECDHCGFEVFAGEIKPRAIAYGKKLCCSSCGTATLGVSTGDERIKF